jgi:serine/threonine-protein kinase
VAAASAKESAPTAVDVSQLPEAKDDAAPVAPAPARPSAPASGPAAGKPADADLVIEEAAPKMAFLTVDANPYATVFIDGEKKGITPLVRIELTPGLHRMIARAEDGKTKRFTLQLDAGKTETVKVVWSEGE